MKKFIFLVLLLGISIYAGTTMVKDPGYAYFSYGHYAIEMPLWLTVLSIVLLVFLSGFIVTISKNLGRISMRFKRRHQKKCRLNAMRETNTGMMIYLTGDYPKAEKHLLKGIIDSNPTD